jgi:hypothetical protein
VHLCEMQFHGVNSNPLFYPQKSRMPRKIKEIPEFYGGRNHGPMLVDPRTNP